MIKKIVAIALITGSLALSACNTIAGAGEDVESVGETVQDVAN